ncbi:embryonic polarity protein dorsal isoform X2 [Bradysia coprophila]|uniref:embryonic polarity protein dorsal isoform X2 n=2 Tax=Bradysia coprophila TaxID=38358 RepID=UPI00187D98E6|nr:embryonic polarity protein dorsal isoform X2 [Bradysia coprophila]
MSIDLEKNENVVTSHGSDENSQINISDVIEVIQTTDPQAQAMFNNVADVTMQASQIHPQPQSNANTSNAANSSNSINSYRRSAFVKITEQPASKALRFRYECEGRSAGSIPGVLSSPENKTFPSIQVVGYRGRAVVVVSCVTKDPPYRPHPHNLVGKEGCKKGVCTVEINSDTMSVTFSNLGIQCVKKRDIDEALRVREEIRVDPYRTGFNHRSQPSSIDLNAVRLCFQVFLESEQRGRFTVPLSPVVSDPIFDKKAMSDLVICKLSDASCTVAGGKEMILLCEKVAKEDISVRFFEEIDDNIVWEGYGDFQHTNVHKQVAIWFRTPRYKSIDIDQPVRCYVQLKRPSDGVTSEPLPFDYLPLDSGRRSIWTTRKGQNQKSNFDLLSRLLDENKSILSSNGENKPEIIDLDTPIEDYKSLEEKPMDEAPEEQHETLHQNTDKTTEWIQKTEFDQDDEHLFKTENTTDDDKTLNELLDQVAELDEIYTDHQLKIDNGQSEQETNGFELSLPKATDEASMDFDELFDDAATYTSLQIAFKNPVPIIDLLPPSPPVNYNFNNMHYDAVEPQIVTPLAPIIDVGPLKRESPTLDDEKLPPLPPKRVKKSNPNNENEMIHDNFQRHDIESNVSSSPKSPSQKSTPSKIIIMKTPDQSPLNKRLPPTPSSNVNSNTLPKQHKKPGFFSKLFSRRKSRSDVNENVNVTQNTTDISPDPSLSNFNLNDPNRSSIKSLQMPTKKAHSKPVGRSVSSVSGKRPNLTANIIHIPLKGDSLNSIPMKTGSGTLLALPGTEAYERASTATLSNNLDRKTVSALQLADLPLQDGNMELIAIADRQSLKNLCEGEFGVQLDPSVDLTEAEHYALYTSIAPHATESEFDEQSCYYAPVEAGEILTQSEVARRLASNFS